MSVTDAISSEAAGPSHVDFVPPPEFARPDDAFPTDQILLRLSPKRSFLGFRKGKRRSKASLQQAHAQTATRPLPRREASGDADPLEMPFVQLGNTVLYSAELEEDYTRDVYRWAVLYENQRGVTLFSTPYYSQMSLLPFDPPPFTIPSGSHSTYHQPTVSLSYFPLPDGNWKWVSRTWMVDMRGDGQTQYDGFEYNWLFRKKSWRPEVGSVSAGGWVRRRRWVRLMMRPALANSSPEPLSAAPTPHLAFQDILHVVHHEGGATRPPSVLSSSPDTSDDDARGVWRGDPEGDWRRCHQVLRKVGTDGRHLEIWRHWLALDKQKKGKDVRWTEDDHILSSETMHDLTSGADHLKPAIQEAMTQPSKDHIAAVLHTHGADILQLFTYPDTRTHFLELLARAGLASDLTSSLGPSPSSPIFDFYSSSQSIQNLLASD